LNLREWDAIIVGAGPAGSALASRLRPRNRVLLIERASPSIAAASASSNDGSARIGESLPGAARVLLQGLGVFDRFLDDAHVERGATVSAWETVDPVWFDHLRDPNGAGWHLDRTRFDAMLRQAAVAAGAERIDDCGRLQVARSGPLWCVDVEHGAARHVAPVLVDASGRNAAILRRLGIARSEDDPLICLYAYATIEGDDEDQCTRVCADRNGWWYSVRVPSGRRVLAFHLDRDDEEMKSLRDSQTLFAKAKRQPMLAEVLGDRAVVVPVHARPAGSAACDLDAMRDAPSGLFAIGDAVLAFDPIASQGLFHALASAESAARAIDAESAQADAARAAFLAEMNAVQVHYRARLDATYAAVSRYRDAPFWSRRCIG